MQTGLILEGGALRGLFTAGVLDVLMENGITFPAAVGVSAGAAFGCNYKSRQIGRAVRYNLAYCRDKRYCSVRSLLLTGDMFGAKFCYHDIPEHLDPLDWDAYDQNPMAFYAVCTDLETGEAVYHLCEKAEQSAEWFRASASMPLVSRPVVIDGRPYLDGGIADAIPLRFFREQGFEKNVVILTRPRDYVKQPDRTTPLVRVALRKYPKIVSLVEKHHLDYNEQRKDVFATEKAGETFVICPDRTLPIGRISHDPKELQETYELGCRIGKARLEKLREFLGE